MHKTKNSAWKFLLSGTLVLAVAGGAVPFIPLEQADAQIKLKGSTSRTVRLANRQFELGKWEEAEKLYTQAVKANPKDPEARAGLSVVQAELFKLDAAEKNAREALAKNPKNSNAHVALAMALKNRTASSDMEYRSKRDEYLNKAVEELKTAIRLDPQNAIAYNRLGEVYKMQENNEQAMEAFQRAVELDQDYSEAIANEGTIYKAKGDNLQAIERYKEAIRLNTKNYKAHYYLGEALTDEGRYHEALQSFNTALYQNRNSAMIHTKMGQALEKQGNESAAISQYREAIRLKPEYLPAYQQLAKLFDYRGDGELAIAELKSGLNINPKADAFKLAIARLSLANNKSKQALQYYNEVLQNDPNNPDALKGLSQTLLVTAQESAAAGSVAGSDNYVEAEQAIDKALKANPNDIGLHLAKLRVSRLAGDTRMAEEELSRIMNNTPKNEVEKIAKGEALLALARYPESDELFRNLISEYKGDTQKQLQLAETLMINGDLDTAAEAYKAVRAQDSDSLKATRGLQRIENVKEQASKNMNLAYSLNNWYSKKQRRSAKDFYLETINMYPRQPEARLALAKLYNSEDQFGKAAFEYEAYLNLMPNMEADKRAGIEKKIRQLKQKEAEQAAKRNAGKTAQDGQGSSIAKW